MIAVHFSVSLDQSQLSGWELMGEVLSARFTNCCRPYAGVTASHYLVSLEPLLT